MKRHTLITIHLLLSMFLLPFLLMMPISGTLYLLGEKGDQTKEKIFEIKGALPSDSQEREDFLRQTFQDLKLNPHYESIKESGDKLIFRPTSREHLSIKVNPEGFEIYRVSPNFIQMMMELHKGHGPRLFKIFEMVFGVGLILVALSGFLVGWFVPAYRIKILSSFGLGLAVFLVVANL